jgi:hypothetical protein
MTPEEHLADFVHELQARDGLAREARLQRLGAWRSMLAASCDDVPFGPERLTLREHKQRVDAYVSALLRDDVDTRHRPRTKLCNRSARGGGRGLIACSSPSRRRACATL